MDVLLRPGLLTGSIAPIERPWTLSLSQWLGNVTLTESWRPIALPFHADQQYILGQAWTLCYEEQFYIVTGIAILARPWRYFHAAALVTVATLVIQLLAPLAGVRVRGFFFDGYWLAFAAGVLVYWQVNYGGSRDLWRTWLLLAGGIAYALLAVPPQIELGRDLASAMLFAGLLLLLHRWDDRVPGSPMLRPLAFAGTICYSLYLSHAVIVRPLSQALRDAGLTSPLQTVVLVLPVCVVAAVVVGTLFHRIVERRFLNRPTSAPGPTVVRAPGSAPGAVAGP